ncbi:MAG: insulinase family protein [Bacilli bacterium]|nr:insulinase family protein [Bacilli bacterium]
MEEIILDNGLRIYLYQDKRRHSTLFQHVTLFGGLTKDFSIDGKNYHLVDGVSHILEHYVVECNEEGNFIKELGERQMNTNASTHLNMTRFYFDTVEDIEFGILKMLKGLYHVSFDEKKLEKLKNPIYQEIRGRSNSKFFHSNIKMMENLFHQYSFRNISGSVEDVSSVNIDLLETCYEGFYQPNNQIIFIAGNFNKEKVLTLIKDFFNDLNLPKHDVKLLPIKEEDTVAKKEDIVYFSTPEEYVEISFKINISNYSPVERIDIDYFIGNFLQNHFGITSSLYQKFVKEKVITTTIRYSSSILYDYYIVSIGGYTSKKDIFVKGILDKIKKMDSFDQDFFELEKKNVIMDLILRDENIISMMMPFVNNVVDFHYPYLDTVDELEKLTYQDYVSSIKKLNWSNYTIITIKDKKEDF